MVLVAIKYVLAFAIFYDDKKRKFWQMYVTEKGINVLGCDVSESQGSYCWNRTTSVPKSVPRG